MLNLRLSQSTCKPPGTPGPRSIHISILHQPKSSMAVGIISLLPICSAVVFCYCSAAETSQPHPTTAMRVSSTLIPRASSGFSLGMASRISHYPLHSRRTPLLCHHRQQFSLWSLASIVKNKGAPRYPSLAVNFDWRSNSSAITLCAHTDLCSIKRVPNPFPSLSLVLIIQEAAPFGCIS